VSSHTAMIRTTTRLSTATLATASAVAVLSLVVVLIMAVWLLTGAWFASTLRDPFRARVVNLILAAALVAATALAILH